MICARGIRPINGYQFVAGTLVMKAIDVVEYQRHQDDDDHQHEQGGHGLTVLHSDIL